MSLFQNSGTDFFGRKAGALDIDKKIDAALWRIKDTHIRSFLNLLSGKEHALAKNFTDFRFQFFTVLQSKDGSALRDRWSGKHYIFVDLLHDLDDFFRSRQPVIAKFLEKELMTIVRSRMPSIPKSGRNGCS